MGLFKRALKKAIISSPFLQEQVSRLVGDFPRVFVFHRFSEAGVDYPHRVRADIFRWQLEQISKTHRVIQLCECIEHYRDNGKWPEHSAIITVDDGYKDFYQIGFPVLRDMGLPATFFVTTNFVNGNFWLWPDRLEYALNNTEKKKLSIEIGGSMSEFAWEDRTSVAMTWKTLADHCVNIPDKKRRELINYIENRLEVTLQSAPPEEYEAVTWGELEKMAENGIEIGSHSLNHPILSRVPSHDLLKEVNGSKVVLEQRLRRPVRTFCYPNSGPGDINEEVTAAVAKAGYIGAVFGTDLGHWSPYEVPRMGVSNDRDAFLAKLAGIEKAGLLLKNYERKLRSFTAAGNY